MSDIFTLLPYPSSFPETSGDMHYLIVLDSIAGFSYWSNNGYIQFANDDGHVGPGSGGQAFDAEYLYYKLNGNTLYLGLQTGFNIVDGNQYPGVYPKSYL